MSRVEVDYLGEGLVDEAIARKLIVAAAGRPGTSYRRPRAGYGKASLDLRLAGINRGVEYGNAILILRDLDRDAPCPAALIARLLPFRHPRLLLRVCVRTAEAWLMADHLAYGRHCGIAARRVPSSPDDMADAKQTILGWVATGEARKLRRHIEDTRRRAVPDWASLGEWHAAFVHDAWNAERAASSGRSPSLSKALSRVREHVARG